MFSAMLGLVQAECRTCAALCADWLKFTTCEMAHYPAMFLVKSVFKFPNAVSNLGRCLKGYG